MAKRQNPQTINIPLNLSQALALTRPKQKPVLEDLREEYEGQVVIQFESAVPAVTLLSIGYAMNEVHFKVVKRLQEFRDFCVLDMKIESTRMGRFIGKNGRNITSLRDKFQEVEIKAHGDSNCKAIYRNVTITGKQSVVEKAGMYIQQLHNAERVGYQTFDVWRRRGIMPQAPARNDGVSEIEAVFYKYHAAASIVGFVKKSATRLEVLESWFPSQSLLMNENEGIVTVVGQTNDIDQWKRGVKANLAGFFDGFLCREVHFHIHTKITRSDIDTDDLVVAWDVSGLKATVWGLKEKVIEILNWFEVIKNRKRPVSAKFTCEKSLHLFMKRNLGIDDTTTADGITLTEEHVEFHSEILEVDSYEEWKSKCKTVLEALLSRLAHQTLEVPPIYRGQMLTECCQSKEYVVEWSQENSYLSIYGLKEHVLEKTKALQGILYELKNRKKIVSMQYQCQDAEIFTFIKESVEHFELLVKELGRLGSPVLDSNIVTVNAQILETQSTAKWEEECSNKLEQFWRRYEVAWVIVEDDIRTHCVSLAESRIDVVTRWIDNRGAFCIVGIKLLVNVSECRLKEKISKVHEDEKLINNTDELVGPDIESSVVIPVNDKVTRHLHLVKSLKSIQGVSIAKTSGGVKISGQGSKVQKVKECINSLHVEDLSVKRFGVYRFLKETSTRVLIGAVEIKTDCSIHVERLPDIEYGVERFVLLPKSSITVKVEEGDITKENVDLIVNTTNKIFSFDGPLSTFVFGEAGDHLRSQVEVIDNDIRSSDGGSLKCKMIFHVAIPETGETMYGLILKILRRADQMKMKSIAMPTIGAGNGGWKSEDISTAMQQAFSKFAAESNNLKLIKVILFPSMSNTNKQLFRANVKIENHRMDVMAPVQEEHPFVSFWKRLFGRKESTPVQEVSPEHADPAASTSETQESQHARILLFATNQANLNKLSAQSRTMISQQTLHSTVE